MKSSRTPFRLIGVFICTLITLQQVAHAQDYSVPVVETPNRHALSFEIEVSGNVWETWKSNVFQQVYPAEEGGWATFWGEVCHLNEIPCTNQAWRSLKKIQVMVPVYRLEPISTQIDNLLADNQSLQQENDSLNAAIMSYGQEIQSPQEEAVLPQDDWNIWKMFAIMAIALFLLACGLLVWRERKVREFRKILQTQRDQLRKALNERNTLWDTLNLTMRTVYLPPHVKSRLGNMIYLPRGHGDNIAIGSMEMNEESAKNFVLYSDDKRADQLRDHFRIYNIPLD